MCKHIGVKLIVMNVLGLTRSPIEELLIKIQIYSYKCIIYVLLE